VISSLCAVLASIAWAIGSLLFGRIGTAGSGRAAVPPGAMNLGKLVTAGSLLVLTSLVITGRAFPFGAPTTAIVLLALSGVAGLTIGDTAYFGAIVTLGVPRAILLLSSAPVFAALGGWLWLGERLDTRALFGMALVFAGIVLVVTRREAGPARKIGFGVFLGIVAALGQAAGSLLSRRAMQVGLDPLAAAAGRIVIGGVGLYAIALVTRDARGWTTALGKDRAWLRVALASIVGTYFGIWLAQTALQKASSTGVATTLLATSPVFALPIAHVLKMERMTLRSTIGVVVAMVGVGALSIR
jgi:drug/metabolite transporter (DMT)-like permease